MGVMRQFGLVFHQRSMSMPPLERKSPHKGGGEQRRQMGCLRGKLDIDLRRFQARLKQRMELRSSLLGFVASIQICKRIPFL